MNDIQNMVITVTAVEDTGGQIKLKADGRTYSFFKTKRDGSATKAIQDFEALGVKAGMTYEIGYTVSGDKSQYQNVINIKPANSRPAQNAAPSGKSSVTGAIKQEGRNFDREAYEKCCSIWAAAYIGRAETDDVLVAISDGRFWELFQAIRKDGEKRFATGWAKAEAVFKQAPSDDYEAGNKAIEEAQAETQEEGWYEAS